MNCIRCGNALLSAAETCGCCAPLTSSSDLELETQTGSGQAAVGPFSPGATIGRRYRIVRLLGAGGMGAVYEAWDEELRVAVALKAIRQEQGSSSSSRSLEARFKRELLLARRVTHKNVVRIHDIGEVDGVKYITMPYIEGHDLATLLRYADKLPVPRALRIARQVVAGLVAAHEAGVVHRDLKPANIMIGPGDHSQIMDFGIARPAGLPGKDLLASLAAGSSLLRAQSLGQTLPGEIVGTVKYMAPEQAKGLPVDQRADIYAFGLILRDLLLGRRFAGHPGESAAEVLAQIDQPPMPLRNVDRNLPEALDQLVARCLQPKPEQRFESASALAAALDALDSDGRPLPASRRPIPVRYAAAAAAVAALAAIVGGYWAVQTRTAPPTPAEPLSVLVADFDNRTGDSVFDGVLEQALGMGLEEASFVTAYSRTEALGVARQLKAGARLDESTARLVAVREGIDVIVTGSAAPEGPGYRVAVLARDPAHEDPAARPLAEASVAARGKADVLGGVATLAARLRRAFGARGPAGRAAKAETFSAASLEALNAYVRAQAFNYAGKPQEALGAYREAVRLDPGLGRAYAGMGALHRNLGQDAEAEANFKEALKHLDRMTEREKYRTLGGYYVGVARNYEAAIENYGRLVELYPADNAGHSNLALAYLLTRNVPAALSEGRKAVDIYPKNVMHRANYAQYCMYSGDFAKAIAEANTVLAGASDYGALLTLALSHAASGNLTAAAEAYDRLKPVGEFEASLGVMGHADLALLEGRARAAVEVLQAGLAADRRARLAGALARKHVALAEARLAMGQAPQATEAARQAIGVSADETVLLPAARVLLQAGREKEVAAIVQTLEGRLQRQPRAFARLLAGEAALRSGKLNDAIEAFRQAVERDDSWLARFLLGRGYAEAGHFPEALAEFEICLRRRGEATDAFFSDSPTLRYLPPLYYWLARAQQEIGATRGARQNYTSFLERRRAADPADSLAQDATRRLAALPPAP